MSETETERSEHRSYRRGIEGVVTESIETRRKIARMRHGAIGAILLLFIFDKFGCQELLVACRDLLRLGPGSLTR